MNPTPWRLGHAFAWLLAVGLAGWVIAVAAVAMRPGATGEDADLAGLGGAVSGAGLGLWIATRTWPHRRLHRGLIWTGAALLAGGGLLGGLFLAGAAAARRQQPGGVLVGFDSFLLAILAFAAATVGALLLIAGLCGVAAQPSSAPQARASSAQRP